MSLLPFTTQAFAHYVQTHVDHPDWSLLAPKFYVNPTNPWGKADRIDMLMGTWYAPRHFLGQFLMVYPADTDPYGDPYYTYLTNMASEGWNNFLDHAECRRLTALHQMGFRRIAADHLPPGVLNGFCGYWQNFLYDVRHSLSA
jgi:hypothetical protein